jgi:hypothetical protein
MSSGRFGVFPVQDMEVGFGPARFWINDAELDADEHLAALMRKVILSLDTCDVTAQLRTGSAGLIHLAVIVGLVPAYPAPCQEDRKYRGNDDQKLATDTPGISLTA